MSDEKTMPLEDYREIAPDDMRRRAASFHEDMRRRRTVRAFSDRPVPIEVIQDCIRAAARAPSGANLQPWTFVAVSDAGIKSRIRAAAEKVEAAFYAGSATQQWVQALAHLGTNAAKPFLETAPFLIAVFAQRYGLAPDGGKIKHYYVQESVGIATGMLITGLHLAGLATLTYTPARMGFLNRILSRPANEKPFMIVVAGYPAENCRVPVLSKKPLREVAVFLTD